jgi:hypothetical protein
VSTIHDKVLIISNYLSSYIAIDTMSLVQGELYARLLFVKGYGRAMWIPEPSISLPRANREAGICVGDVGLFRPEGSFDFLFNVRHIDGSLDRLPDDNRINFRGVPDGFQRQDISPSDITTYPCFFKVGDHIESGVTRTIDLNVSLSAQQ